MERPCTPGTSAQMDTDDVSPSDARQRCAKLVNLETLISNKSCELTHVNQLIQEQLEMLQRPPGVLQSLIQGELTSLLPCPYPTCQHNTAPKHLEKTTTPCANSSLASKLAETHIRDQPNSNIKTKKNQQDNFAFPTKTAKRPEF
ncbi:hypothetical protein TNCT_449601 [Trichonephila clavata]|uniref:Uncharacterized protein n=1 Tax=Trichonephila clavata TaxID=2740835 RepID=A0A8X6H3B0_TRICU|nr:hypothetical protein TNCT_449601 [Trichonephila clavata]